MNAIIFPGQGSQKVGMGGALHESFAPARDLFKQANEILGYDLSRLCFEGPHEMLTQTIYAQPALLVCDVACWLRAREDGAQAAMTAGHSLGEYAALVAAEALTFEEALRLVKQRAELMNDAPPGAMAALIGLPDDRLDDLLQAAGQGDVLVAANWNSPGQVVVSGEDGAVDRALREAKGFGAKLAVKLPVGGAFHSPLMRDAAAEMSAALDKAPFRDAAMPVYQNTTAAPATAADELRSALKGQMTGAVRWTETMRAMIEAGATQFTELGPGTVLTGLIKRIDKSVAVENVEC